MDKEDLRSYEIDVSPDMDIGGGRVNIVNVLQDPRVRETYRKVEIPEDYRTTFLKKGKETERDLGEKYDDSPLKRFGHRLLKGIEEKTVGWFTEVYIPRDETFEILKKKIEPENDVVKDFLKAADKLNHEDYKEFLDGKDSEESACSAVACKKEVKEERLPRTMNELDGIEELSNVQKTITYRAFSLDPNPDDLYAEWEDFQKIATKLDDYIINPRRPGYAIPMTASNLAKKYETLDDRKMENYAKNIKEMKRFRRYLDYLLQGLEENQATQRMNFTLNNSTSLLTENLDAETQKCAWKAAMAAPGEVDEVIFRINKDVERNGYFRDWRGITEDLGL